MNGINYTFISKFAIPCVLVFVCLTYSCCSTKSIGTDTDTKDEKPADVKPEYKSFSFVQLSDPQLGFLNGNTDYAEDSLLLARAIYKINALKPAFVVMTGDMTNASQNAAQIKCYKTVISKINRRIPIYHVPGNHDVGSGSTNDKVAKYIENYGDDHFSFDYENCHFAGINTCIIKDENRELEEAQWEWLCNDLSSSADSRLTFVIGHHSFFLTSYAEDVTYSNQSKENRDRYWQMFKSNGVDCVFSGHLHDNKRSKHDGIDMITTGPVGKPLGKGYSGVCVWKVDENGSYAYTYYSIDDFEKLERL